jgi:citrate synthase
MFFDILGFPSTMFPVLQLIPKTIGYVSHFIESIDDPEWKIFRPRQIYIGNHKETFKKQIDEVSNLNLESKVTRIFRPRSFFK